MENVRGPRTANREANGADELYTIGGSPAMQACSACAGDYEDPDRTSGSEDELPDEDAEREVDERDADGEELRENEVRPTRRQN